MQDSRTFTGLQQPWLCAAIPCLVAGLSIGALVIVGLEGWLGPLGINAGGFCERFRDGIIKQPANTWSSLGFVAVGIWIGFTAMRDRAALRVAGGPAPSRMSATNGYPVLYASLAVLLGPGAAAMHASTTDWAGVLDRMSMYVWIAFPVAYGLTRLRDLSGIGFVAIYLAIALPFCLLIANDAVPISGDFVLGTLIFTLAATEVAIGSELSGRRAWLVAATCAFLLAFGTWLPSRTGGAWCDPDSLLQGHAVWHLLCAVAVACIFAFYRSERARTKTRSDRMRP